MEFNQLLHSLNFAMVFLEGVVSFLSPCIIPLIPLYMGYLMQNAKTIDEATQKVSYRRKTVLLYTVFFILGITTTFFLLGLSVTALSSLLRDYHTWITRIGGLIIVAMGMFQLGIFQFSWLNKERKLSLKLKKMSLAKAYLLGFVFSFSWTPCVGPALSSVLIMAGSIQNALIGNLLILVYALGMIIPFLLLGLFSQAILSWLKDKQKWLGWITKAGGTVLIFLGFLMMFGMYNAAPPQEFPKSQEEESMAAPDTVLEDQYGNEIKLSDYRGKIVFLQFWGTWCTYCKQELPSVEQLYLDNKDQEDGVVVLGAVNLSYREKSMASVKQFLSDNHYTFPTLFDRDGAFFNDFYIQSYPTTFMIDEEGNIFGYVQGALNRETMDDMIRQTKEKAK